MKSLQQVHQTNQKKPNSNNPSIKFVQIGRSSCRYRPINNSVSPAAHKYIHTAYIHTFPAQQKCYLLEGDCCALFQHTLAKRTLDCQNLGYDAASQLKVMVESRCGFLPVESCVVCQ